MQRAKSVERSAGQRDHALASKPQSRAAHKGTEGAGAGVPIFLKRCGHCGIPPSAFDEREAEDTVAPDTSALQPKMIVSPPDDPAEHEADAVAARVVSGEAPTIRRSTGGPIRSAGVASVQRKCACEGSGTPCADCTRDEDEDGETRLQRAPESPAAATSAPAAAAPMRATRRVLALGGGTPLGGAERSFFEPRFGHGFDRVRVHTGPAAEAAAAELRAQAFTRGVDIYFGAARFRPDTPDGQRLIAHELTHTIQQDSGGATACLQRQPDTAVADPATAAEPDAGEPAEVVDRVEAGRRARAVYNALDGLNDEEDALAALRGCTAGMRTEIRAQFFDLYDTFLEDWLNDQLDGDDLVNAFALLSSPTETDEHAALARALISDGVRDQEVLRLLEARSGPPGRQRLANQYDAAFGRAKRWMRPTGGSLVQDIQVGLWDYEEQKALTLLDRDLTDADTIYFDSVGIVGTHDEAVVDGVERAWREGASGIQRLIREWDSGVKSAHPPWVPSAFTSMDFKSAMEDELNDESWSIVKAILDAHERLSTIEDRMAGDILLGDEPTERDLMSHEDIQLEVARAILDAAAEGAGTNEQQVFYAIREIERIWRERIRRAGESGDRERADRYAAAWTAAQPELLSIIADQMSEGGTDYMRARLVLAGELTPADEVFLADSDGDNDKVLLLATEAWARGEIDALKAQCEVPRRALLNGELVVVRPAFTLITAVPVSHGEWGRRLYPLVDTRLDQRDRGVARLTYEIDNGDSDSDLQRAREFLTTQGLSNDARDAVVVAFATDRLNARPVVALEGESAEDHAKRQFVDYLMERYERSRNAFAVQELLVPTDDPDELANRAQQRIVAERGTEIDPATMALLFATGGGVVGLVIDPDHIVRAVDAITGNDTEQVTEESAARLRWIADAARNNPAALREVLEREGVTVRQLARNEYTLFEQRFEDWADLRTQVVETLATIIEIAVDLAIVAATGGGAGPLILAALASTVAGIVVREAGLGANYDAVSQQNAQRLVMAVAAAGLGAGVHGLAGVDVTKLSRLGAFGYRASTEAATQVGVQFLQTSFASHYPTAEEIAAAGLRILASASGAGVGGAGTRHARDIVDNAARRARHIVIWNASESVLSGLGDEAGAILSSEGDLSAGEIVGRLGRRGLADLGRGTVSGGREAVDDSAEAPRPRGTRDIDAGEATPRRTHRPEDLDAPPRRSPADADSEATTRRAGAEDPRAIDESARQRAAEPHHERGPLPPGEGVLAARSFNDGVEDHTLSIVRTSSGEMFVAMCSDHCGRLLARVERALARRPGDVELQHLRDEVVALHQRMTESPDDPHHAGDLEELADSLEGTLRSRTTQRRAGAWRTEGGETHVDVDTVRRFLAEEGADAFDEWLPDSLAGLDSVAIGPSIERRETGDRARQQFIEQGLPHLRETRPDLAARFDEAQGRSDAISYPGPPRYNWPADDGSPWRVHHGLPLEWTGIDDPGNYVAVPEYVHYDIHRLWTRVNNRLRAAAGGRAEPGEQRELVPDVE